MNHPRKVTFLSGVFALASVLAPYAHSEQAAPTTVADHDAVASRYESEATELKGRINEHSSMSAMYGGMGKSGGSFRTHCDRLVQAYKTAEKESSALADMHHKMATKLKN